MGETVRGATPRVPPRRVPPGVPVPSHYVPEPDFDLPAWLRRSEREHRPRRWRRGPAKGRPRRGATPPELSLDPLLEALLAPLPVPQPEPEAEAEQQEEESTHEVGQPTSPLPPLPATEPGSSAEDHFEEPAEGVGYAAEEEAEEDPGRFRRAYIATFAGASAAAVVMTAWLVLAFEPGRSEPAVAVELPSSSPAPTSEPTAAPTAAPTSTLPPGVEEVSVFDLEVGDCLNLEQLDSATEVVASTVWVVECSDLHTSEIIHIDHLDDPPEAPFPGAAERDEASRALCEPAFEAYVGTPLNSTELSLLWLAPTAETWAEGDREVTCAAEAPGGVQLTESVAGSRR